MNQVFEVKMHRSRDKKGMTLMEVLLSVVLMSVVFLAFTALYTSSQRFYLAANNQVIIRYELQYAVQHIYKNVIRAIGDEASPPINIPSSDTLNIRINNNDPLSSSNYSSIVTYTYSRLGDNLWFNDGVNPAEPLVPKIDISDVSFSLDGDLLVLSLTGVYNNKSLTFHAACYPRLASFQ
jgi:prepilin-type N-terminal cleavage/methylation domain-containing protein